MKKQKTKTHSFRLPSKPSKLIRAALEDLEKVEALPNQYSINMSAWHQPSAFSPQCMVCLAGSTIACRSGYTNRKFLRASSFPVRTRYKLYALNAFRRGQIYEGLELLKIDPPKYETTPGIAKLPYWLPVAPYALSSEEFKSDMRNIAIRLEKVGL